MAKVRASPPGAGGGAAVTSAPVPVRGSGTGLSTWLPLALLDQVRGRSLLDALREPDPLSNFFRPVSRQLYFWAIAGLTHESPAAFHVGNLLTLLAIVVLLARLVRHLAGPRAAVLAAGFMALHYAAEVPVRWACGSQELLAVAGALAAIHLHVSGRRLAAGLAMLGAAFSKEVVLLAPVIATVADHAPREPWRRTARRAWPLAAATLIWGASFMALPHRRAGQGTEVEIRVVQSPLATIAHLFQVAPGIEWLPGRFGAVPRRPPPLLPTLAVMAAIVIAWRQPVRGRAGPEARGRAEREAREPAAPEAREPADRDRHALWVAAVWTLLATVPVAAVALLWSAHYYLFAMAGVALGLGVVLARAPAWAACGALALLAWGSANARGLPEFGAGRDPWTPVSHINRRYIERASRISARYLSSLQRAYPKFPPGSTVYFAGLAANSGFQAANGPLLRWAYRDSSLRAYYLNMFSLRTVRPGPLYFFVGAADTLREMEGGDERFLRIAYGLIVSDQVAGARDALDVFARRTRADVRTLYWQSWVSRALGDTAAAQRQLAASGALPGAGAPHDAAARDREAVLARLTARDTLGAIDRARAAVRSHALDAGAHGLLADLTLIRSPDDPGGAIEAFAARVLAPEDPFGWRRWATVQARRERYLEALASYQTYLRLGGAAAAADAEARAWADHVRAMIAKGSSGAVDAPPR